MLVAPSDHVIADVDAFQAAVKAGADAAKKGQLVTFGIQPRAGPRPATAIWNSPARNPGPRRNRLPSRASPKSPMRRAAQALMDGGRHLWNAGIFLFRVSDILAAFEKHAKEAHQALPATPLKKGETDLNFFRLDARAYGKADDISLDYAVMEKAGNLSVVPYDAGAGPIWAPGMRSGTELEIRTRRALSPPGRQRRWNAQTPICAPKRATSILWGWG